MPARVRYAAEGSLAWSDDEQHPGADHVGEGKRSRRAARKGSEGGKGNRRQHGQLWQLSR